MQSRQGRPGSRWVALSHQVSSWGQSCLSPHSEFGTWWGQGVAVALELESLRVNSSVLQRPVPLWAAGSGSGPASGWSPGGRAPRVPAAALSRGLSSYRTLSPVLSSPASLLLK